MTTSFKPRDYQADTITNIHKEFESRKSTLAVMATGLGKTFVFSHIANEYIKKGRVMVLAERDVIVGQNAEHLKEVTGVDPDTEMGKFHSNSYGAFRSEIVVGTIQTQNAGRGDGYKRMTKFEPDEFSLLVIDEAHHAVAPSYRRVIDYYQRNPNLKVLGVTATPDRGDEGALGQVFDSVAADYELAWAIENGWLVGINQQSVYVEGLDYSSVKTTAGELNQKDLARVLEFEEILHGFCSPIIEKSGDRKTLVFAASCAQAERMTEILNRHKPNSAMYVHGGTGTEEREQLWPAYAAGDFQYLVNVGITIEGWNEPGVELIAIARPTKVRSRYAQMVGRGTRALAGVVDGPPDATARKMAIAASAKTEVEVLDFVGNAGLHDLVTPPDILGGNYDENIIARCKLNAQKKSVNSGKPVDVIEELLFAQQQLKREEAEEAERVGRSAVLLRAKYSTAKINPFKVFNIEPCRERAWHKGRQPTDNQVACLEKAGVDVKGLSFTHASQLISRIVKMRTEGKASYKMTKCLQRYGFSGELSFDKARTVMTELSNNNWRPLSPKRKSELLKEIGE